METILLLGKNVLMFIGMGVVLGVVQLIQMGNFLWTTYMNNSQNPVLRDVIVTTAIATIVLVMVVTEIAKLLLKSRAKPAGRSSK